MNKRTVKIVDGAPDIKFGQPCEVIGIPFNAFMAIYVGWNPDRLEASFATSMVVHGDGDLSAATVAHVQQEAFDDGLVLALEP
jgi:hypothetical protein